MASLLEPKFFTLLLGSHHRFENADRILNAMTITTIGVTTAILVEAILDGFGSEAIILSVVNCLLMLGIYYLGRSNPGRQWLIWPFMLCNYGVL